jgi:hypothetical protein
VRHNRTSLALGVTAFSTLALVCVGLIGVATLEGNFPIIIEEAPFAGGRGAAYFVDSGRPQSGLQNVLFAGIRCERGELFIWAERSVVSAARKDAGLPYIIDGYEMTLPTVGFCGPNHEIIP